MRLAVIADIHGNLVALDAVLRAIDAGHVDRVICLGDVAATGPQPREVIARLRTIGCDCVMGNADQELLHPILDPEGEEAPRWLAIDRWCAEQLTPDDLDYLNGFAPTVSIDLGHGRSLLAYHGSPHSFDDRIVVSTPELDLDDFLGQNDAAVFAGGHTHQPFVRTHGQALVLNPGSVGLRPPGTSYALVDAGSERIDVGLHFLSLPVDDILNTARASGMPECAWWSSFWN